MQKYYTRACNFYFGKTSKQKIKKNLSLALNGNNSISFDSIEVISKTSKQITNIKNINKLPSEIKKKVLHDLKKICKKKKIKGLDLNDPPLLMGVLNLTPDSFSDGGKFNKDLQAKKQINKLINDGAKIIDVGGESTRPGSQEIKKLKEWNRIKNSMKYLMKNKFFVSVDTRKSLVMKKALNYKLDLVNDISGLSYDKDTIEFLKKTSLPFVLHHIKGTPKTMQINPNYKNVLLDIYDYFEEKLRQIRKKGIKHNNIILDPGIGFGKNLKHNITLINKISIFHSLGLPIMLGVSRKKFIKDISGLNDSKERVGGTVASCIYSMSQGVQILRVHDVNEINQGIKVFKKLNY